MMPAIDWLVDLWLRRCRHEGQHVAADIAEGGWDGCRVAKCRRCGATRLHFERHGTASEWDRPRPLWFAVGRGP